MKKLLILLLCLVTALGVAGCSSKTYDNQVEEPTNKPTKVIDLGGSLGTITLEGEAFGSYKVVETPEEFDYEDVEITVYEDLNSNTPYITVYRYAKNGLTLEEEAQKEADLYSNGYYQLFDSNDMVNCHGAYFCTPHVSNGNYYYDDIQIIEDGDEFVEIEFSGKTEELQIGDTNVYAYVPVGYTSHIDDDYKAHNAYFAATYSDDYYFPNMFVGKWEYTYEYMKWFYEEDFPEGLPFTEEEFNADIGKWINGEGDMHAYYETFGDTVAFDSYEAGEVFDYNGCYYVLEGGKVEGTEIWFEINGDWYVAWFETDLEPVPAYATTFLSSLHTK